MTWDFQGRYMLIFCLLQLISFFFVIEVAAKDNSLLGMIQESNKAISLIPRDISEEYGHCEQPQISLQGDQVSVGLRKGLNVSLKVVNLTTNSSAKRVQHYSFCDKSGVRCKKNSLRPVRRRLSHRRNSQVCSDFVWRTSGYNYICGTITGFRLFEGRRNQAIAYPSKVIGSLSNEQNVGAPDWVSVGRKEHFTLVSYRHGEELRYAGAKVHISRGRQRFRSLVSVRKQESQLSPRFSFDAKYVAYVRYRGDDNSHIVIVNLKTNREVKILRASQEQQGDVLAPVWAPNSHRLTFLSTESGVGYGYVLYLYDMKADAMVVLGRDAYPNSKSTPSWTPDGAYVVYARQNPAAIGPLVYVSTQTRKTTVIPTHTVSNSEPVIKNSKVGWLLAFCALRSKGDAPSTRRRLYAYLLKDKSVR